MEDKEKYHAEVDARIHRFHKHLNEIRTKLKHKKENPPDIQLDGTIRKYETAKAKAEDLKQADGDRWKKLKHEVDELFNNIDEDLRDSLAYFA